MGVVYVPEIIVEEVERSGVNVVELMLNVITNELNLDPREIAITRPEITEKSLKECEDYLGNGDVVQASEKLYKTVKECIKALAEIHKFPQLKEAKRRSR